MKAEHTTLLCHNCGQEASHQLAYAGRLLVATTCAHCGYSVKHDIRCRYLADLRQRVVTKPGRMLRRFRRHPVSFVSSLPHKTLLKPWELAEEIRLVWSASDSHKHS
jgi:hypothetical protein